MHLPDRVQAVALWAAIALAGGSEPSRFLWDGPWHGGAAVLRLDNTRVSRSERGVILGVLRRHRREFQFTVRSITREQLQIA
jgi:hypothetical protein